MNKTIKTDDIVKDISLLKDELASTTERSLGLLQNFINDQNELTLNQAWTALELITNNLEEIQSKLVKISL